MNYLLLMILAYLIGSVPFSLIFAKLFKGVDVRQAGTGNVGATNTLISAGKLAAALAAIFDIAKGFGAVILARYLVGGDLAVAAAGIAAVLGHDFSVFLKFKGGKGVATTTGTFLAIDPYAMAMILVIYVVLIALTRYLILSTLLGLLMAPVIIYLFGNGWTYAAYAFILFLIALLAHRNDIERFLNGSERRLTDSLKSVV